MSTFNGDRLKIEIYGESHAKRIGGKIENMPKCDINREKLAEFLGRRKASGSVFSTSRKETDEPIFDKEFDKNFDGKFSFYIENKDVKSGDYNELYAKPRPSHADYASFLKDGTLDFSGGGRFSGRMTASLCVIGGICKQYLEAKGIKVCAYVSEIGGVNGKSYKTANISSTEIEDCQKNGDFALNRQDKMLEIIESAKKNGDSVGGKIECIVYNLKGGFGDNLFSGLEGKISSLCYAVPAVKGVEFGLGFDFAKTFGSKANDELYYKDGEVKFYSNNSGGINGGISNGAPITLSVAIRPTPSIAKEERTIDLIKKENVKIAIKGRHDACIVPRAVPCIESAVAIALVDMGV